MENKILSEKLREFARSSSSPYKKQIFKQAAKRIEEQQAVLENARELLKELGLQKAVDYLQAPAPKEANQGGMCEDQK